MSTVVALVHTSHYTCVHRSKIIIDVLSFIEGKLEGKYYIIIKCHMLYNMCTYMHHTDEDAYIHVCTIQTSVFVCTYILYCTRTSLECWTRYAYMMCMFPVYLHTHPLGRRSEKEKENSGLIISRVFSFTLFQMFQMLLNEIILLYIYIYIINI